MKNFRKTKEGSLTDGSTDRQKDGRGDYHGPHLVNPRPKMGNKTFEIYLFKVKDVSIEISGLGKK